MHTTFILREWHEENMDINYVQENPKAMLRHEHAASMRLQLEETLGTFNGYFFVTLYLNAERVTFGYVTRSSTFNDVQFRLHILQPFCNQEMKLQTTSTFTPLLCREGCAIPETVSVLCSTQN